MIGAIYISTQTSLIEIIGPKSTYSKESVGAQTLSPDAPINITPLFDEINLFIESEINASEQNYFYPFTFRFLVNNVEELSITFNVRYTWGAVSRTNSSTNICSLLFAHLSALLPSLAGCTDLQFEYSFIDIPNFKCSKHIELTAMGDYDIIKYCISFKNEGKPGVLYAFVHFLYREFMVWYFNIAEGKLIRSNNQLLVVKKSNVTLLNGFDEFDGNRNYSISLLDSEDDVW